MEDVRRLPVGEDNEGWMLLVSDIDAIVTLRALLPARTLSWSESHAVAERQAAVLLDLMHLSEPPIPMFVISSLPGIQVEWREQWPVSGMSVRASSHWRIVIRAEESRQRQRFSLAHEFKRGMPKCCGLVAEQLRRRPSPR
jgi:hypothetical protein